MRNAARENYILVEGNGKQNVQSPLPRIKKCTQLYSILNSLLIAFKVETSQYDNPIQCYSEEVLKEMSEKGSWYVFYNTIFRIYFFSKL